MLLCQLNPTFTHEDSVNENDEVNWELAADQLSQPELLSCPKWITTMKGQTDNSSLTRHSQTVDINSLNQ